MFYTFAAISGFIASSVTLPTGVAALAYHPQTASAAKENMEKDIGKNGRGCLAIETTRTLERPIHGLNAASTKVCGS